MGRTPPPRLGPPPPPAALRVAATCWRLTTLLLAVSVGVAFLGLRGRRGHVRELVLERAGDAAPRTVDRATDIVLFGGLAAWALLAVLALLLASGVRRPTVPPRLLGLLLLVVLLGVLALTAWPLTGPSGLGLVARVAVLGSGVTALLAALLGLAPSAWRFVSARRAGPAARPPTGSPPSPPPPSGGR